MKVWITKYALTDGVFTVEAEQSKQEPSMIHWKRPGSFLTSYAHGKDWWRSKEEAEARADEMRLKKIASLRKKLQKLEALAISVPE